MTTDKRQLRLTFAAILEAYEVDNLALEIKLTDAAIAFYDGVEKGVNPVKVRGNILDGMISYLDKQRQYEQMTERIEKATGATPTSRWKLDDGPQTELSDGDPVIEWRSDDSTLNQLVQVSTISARPVYNASGINGKPTIDFDGSNDHLRTATLLAGVSGVVFVVYRLITAPNSYQALLVSSDVGSATRYLEFYGRGNNTHPNIAYAQDNNDTASNLKGNTTVSASTDYLAVFKSDGSTITMDLNGVVQTITDVAGSNNGDWWDDSSAQDALSIGASLLAGTAAEFANVRIRRILVYSELTADQISAIKNRLALDAGITLP